MNTILMVDNMKMHRELIREALDRGKFQFTEAEDASQALEAIKSHGADLVFTDLRMPGISSIDLIKELQREFPETAVIVVTACGSVESAVEGMKAGLHDCITRPLGLGNSRSVDRGGFQRVNVENEVRVNCRRGFENMVGHSQSLHQVLNQATRVAPTNATILIQGETGTGKELLARGIHANSKRSGKPFITVNCCAIPRELLESELFGHVRGSFSGAVMDRKGKAEVANGGTLFLDEIGEMPRDLQAKVLRLIQEGEIEKVGGIWSTKVDIRVIAATHRSLPAMVESGAFREDLYYRLNVIQLRLPSLRERLEDIPDLVSHFFLRSCAKHGRKDLTLPERLLAWFSAYQWPGNIRELENTIERIVVLALGHEISVSDLPAFLQNKPTPLEVIHLDLPPKGITLDGIEKEILLRALQKSNWNQSKAAQYLGLSRKKLIYRMHKYELGGPKPSDAPSANVAEAETEWINDDHESELLAGNILCRERRQSREQTGKGSQFQFTLPTMGR